MRRRLSLLVDPRACDGHGVCAGLFLEGDGVEPWDPPLVHGADIQPGFRAHASRAAASHPMPVLHLVEVPA